jgi:hypothetical protein
MLTMQSGELQMWATAIAIVGGSNWLFGGISWRGQVLRLRTSPFWAAIRWLGVGLFAASLLVGTGEEFRPGMVGIVGALLIMLGSARKSELKKPPK